MSNTQPQNVQSATIDVSPPPALGDRSAPPALATVFAMVPLMLRSTATRGRLLALGALGLVGVVIAIILRNAETSDDFTPIDFVARYGLTLLVPIVALVVASASFGNLIERRTLVYLWLRPIRRWQIAAAAFIAGLVIVLPLVVIPTTALAVILGDSDDIVGSLVASAAGAVAYGGLFTLLGLLTQRALAWGLVFILVWEGFVAGLSRGAGQFALSTYTRSLLAQIADASTLVDRPYQVTTSLIVCGAVALVAFALTSWRLSNMDVD